MSNHDGVPGAPAGPGDASQPPAPDDDRRVPAPPHQSQEPQQQAQPQQSVQAQQPGSHPGGHQNPTPVQDRFGGRGAVPQQDPSAARVGAGLKKGTAFLRPSEWASSAIVAASTYVAMLVMAVLIILVVMTAGLAEFADYMGSSAYGNFSDLFEESGSGTGYLFFALVMQLVAMAVGGRFHLTAEAASTGDYSASDELTVFLRMIPVLVTVAGAVVLFFGSRMAARRQVLRFQEGRSEDRVSGKSLWFSSLVTGVMLTVLVAALSAIFAGRATESVHGSGYGSSYDVSTSVHFSAVSPVVFFLPLVFGTLVSQWGRRSALAPVPHRFSDQVHAFLPGIATAARLAGLYFTVLAVICLVVVAVVVGVKAESFAAGLAILLCGTFLVGDILAVAHLSGIVAAGDASGDSASLVGYLWSDQMASSGGHWSMLVWILVAAGILALAFAWAGRRPSSTHPVSWAVMPLVFLLLGFLVLWVGRVHAGTADGTTIIPTVSMGPAWWTPVVFLLWGVVVEVLARFLVPALVGYLPNSGFRRLLLGTPVEPVFSRSPQDMSVGAYDQPTGHGPATKGSVPPPPPGEDPAGENLPGQARSGTALAGTAPVGAVADRGEHPGAAEDTATRPFSPAEQEQTRPITATSGGLASEGPEGDRSSAYALAGQQQPGWRQDPQAQQQPGLAARERTPMSPAARKRLRLSAIVAGAVVLLLVLAFAAVKIVNATVYSPEHVVEDYFNAVVDGDAQAAADTIDPNVGSDQRVLLTNEVYQNATKKITEYDVKDIDVADGGDTATATVAVTQDQRTTDTQVDLVKSGGTLGLVQWEIDPQQSGLYKTIDYTVPAGTDTVVVNGQEVHVTEGATPSASSSAGYDYGSSTEQSGTTVSLTVLPGQYTFGAPKGGTYLTYGEDQQVMMEADGDSHSVSFQQRLTAKAFDDAVAKAQTKLDQCAAVREFEVSACGFDAPYSGDHYRNPSWSITKYPKYAVSNSSYGTSSSSSSKEEADPSQKLYLVPTTSGTAKLDYQYQGFDDDWEDEDTQQSISGYFPLEITADQMTLGDVE